MADISSNGTGGGNWSTGASWTGGVAPGDGDKATIAAGDTITVDADITIGDSAGTQTDVLIINGTLDFGTLTANRTMTVKGSIQGNSGGVMTGDAAGYFGNIYLDNATTNLGTRVDFVGDFTLNLSDTGARTARRTQLTSQANSGQADLIVDDDLSADWKAGDTLIICRNAYNGPAVEEKIISSISGTTITLTTNLSGNHGAGSGVYLISRGWKFSPLNDSYRVREYAFQDGAGNSNDNSIWFRGAGNGSAGTRGIYFYSNYNGDLDGCSFGEIGSGALFWFASASNLKTFTGWTMAGLKFYFNGSATNNNTWVNCHFAGFSSNIISGTQTGNSFYDCYFDSSISSNAYAFGSGSVINNYTNGCYFRGLLRAFQVDGNVTGLWSEDDTCEYTNTYFRLGDSNFGDGTFINPTLNGSSWAETNAAVGSEARIHKVNGDANYHVWVKSNGSLSTSGAGLPDTTTRTAGELALRVAPQSGYNVNYSFTKSVVANSTIAVYGYMRKDSTYGSSTLPKITLTSQDGAISTSYTMTDVDDTWEYFVLSGEVGSGKTYITLKLEGENSTGGICYFADMQLIIGNATTGVASGYKIGTLWREGKPTMDEPLGGTVDGDFLADKVWDEATSGHTTADTYGELPDKVNNSGIISTIL